MKLQKKIFYSLLVFVVLSQIISPIVFSADSNSLNYLALGDSIAEGYGLNNVNTERYSSLITKEKSYSETNLAKSGMTCKVFYELISQDNKYRTAIQNADVITISIGSNELLKTAIEIIKNAANVENDNNEQAIALATTKFKNATKLEQIEMLKALATGFTSEDTKTKLDNGVKQYETYWKKSILEINNLKKSDATIVVTEFYNPYQLGKLSTLMQALSGSDSLQDFGLSFNSNNSSDPDVGILFDSYINNMNQILREESNNQSNYKIAEIKSTFDKHNYFGTPKYTNVSFSTSSISLDPHPNVNRS